MWSQAAQASGYSRLESRLSRLPLRASSSRYIRSSLLTRLFDDGYSLNKRSVGAVPLRDEKQPISSCLSSDEARKCLSRALSIQLAALTLSAIMYSPSAMAAEPAQAASPIPAEALGAPSLTGEDRNEFIQSLPDDPRCVALISSNHKPSHEEETAASPGPSLREVQTLTRHPPRLSSLLRSILIPNLAPTNLPARAEDSIPVVLAALGSLGLGIYGGFLLWQQRQDAAALNDLRRNANAQASAATPTLRPTPDVRVATDGGYPERRRQRTGKTYQWNNSIGACGQQDSPSGSC